MEKQAMYHQAHGKYAYPVGPDTLRVVLRTKKGDLQRVTVVYQDRYPGGPEYSKVMERSAQDEMFDYYQVDLTLETARFAYMFWLDDGIEQIFMNEKGFFADPPENTEFQYPYIAPRDLWEPPAWSQGALVYQIFPERFANGDPNNDPADVEPWDVLPTRESMKGGDLQGILDHLDHIVDLGVDVLYLTPIFVSPSNHKYNITDYYAVDPHFGDLDDCRALVEACHDKGIRVVFDAVFNHCGYEFFAFQDVLAHGRQSRYWDWFAIADTPITTDPPNYLTFARDIWTMPKLMTQNPEVREYLLGVAEYWIKECDIDGWRLDVANEVDHEFWREFRRRVKTLKPDALIVGEIWHEASEWVQGDQFDSVMNYPFRDAVCDWLGEDKIRAGTFAQRLAKVQMNHRQAVNLAMYNLFDSHDTARFLTLAAGDKAKLRLAAGLMLTYEGSPMVYYGDEVGMEGENDPDCRRGMIWDKKRQDRELLQWYQDLASLRRTRPVLRTGNCRTVMANGAANVFGFCRYDDQDQIVVLVNNSAHERQVPMADSFWPLGRPPSVRDLLTQEAGTDVIRLQPFSMAVVAERR